MKGRRLKKLRKLCSRFELGRPVKSFWQRWGPPLVFAAALLTGTTIVGAVVICLFEIV